MKISTKGRYALRVMIDLAGREQGKYISLHDIAAKQMMPKKYLEQIIAMLHKAGYITSARGNSGGYMLARKPEEYTAGEIITATEGSLSLVECIDGGANCSRSESCKSRMFWAGLSSVISEYMNSVTLADLLEDTSDDK